MTQVESTALMVNSTDWRPLTSAQTGIWIAQQLDPGSPAFSTGQYVDIPGPVSIDLLQQAIRCVLDACEILRLDLAEIDGRPYQRVTDRSTPAVVVDLSAKPDSARLAVALMRDDLATPIDLLRASEAQAWNPIVGSTVFVLPGSRALWYLRAHHIAIDGYAASLLTQRVAAAYSDLVAGFAPNLESAPLSVVLDADAAYQGSADEAADAAFWRDEFADVGADIASLASTAAVSISSNCLRAQAKVDPTAVASLSAASESLGATWPDLLVALHAVYLHKVTGTTRPVLGLPVMNRLGSPAAKVPAMVMNVVPIVVPTTSSSTLAGVTRDVVRARRRHRRHLRYRGEQLRRDLRLVGEGRRLHGPLVNILPLAPELAFGNSVASLSILATGPIEDLTLTISANPRGELDLLVEANRRAYDQEAVDAHLARLVALIERAPAALHAEVGSVSVLTADERERVLYEWNATEHAVPDTTIVDLFAEQVERTPNAPAVIAESGVLTYAELEVASRRLARQLIDAGAGPGRLVAVAIPRSVELSVALWAILRTGAAYLPLELDYPEERLSFMLDDADPVVVVCTDGCARCGDDAPSVVLDTAALLAEPTEPAEPMPDLRGPTPTDPAYVIYTSGSTGQPKGVVVGHRALVNRLLWMQNAYVIDSSDRILQKTPAGFDVSVWEFFWPLICGAALVMARPGEHRDPAYLAEVIEAEQITTAHFVPSMLAAFLAQPDLPPLRRLRRVICSGEALPVEVVDRFAAAFPAVELHNLYGPTEACIDVSSWHCRPGESSVPIGRPVWNTRLYVLDDRLEPVPIGAAGELYLGGVQLADGYLKRAELTAERFIHDPFVDGGRLYRTGDLATWRTDGAVEYLGRTDFQVKLRGQRIELGEIEHALGAHRDVASAVVTVVDQQLIGYVVPRSGAALDVTALRRHLQATLPTYMVPSVFVGLTSLPVTANGKLDRGAIPAPKVDHGHESGSADAAAMREVEAAREPKVQLVADVFAEVLDVPRVGPDDSFFDLGGHSLLAVSLAQRLTAAFGIAVSVGSVFSAPTPQALAGAMLGGGPDTSLAPIFKLREGSGVPLWCIHPAGGLSWCYTGLVRLVPPSTPIHTLQARSLDCDDVLPTSISEMAADYARLIVADQPDGPYQLLGWSVGGDIAHAVAACLQGESREVTLLALLDAYPSDQWRDLELPDESDALRALLHIGGVDPATVPHLDRDAVIEVLRQAGSALSTLEPATLSAMAQVVANNNKLLQQHAHTVVDGDVHFFTAAQPRPEDWLDRDGWKPYVGGQIHNLDLPCQHAMLMSAPMLDRIADVLVPLLR